MPGIANVTKILGFSFCSYMFSLHFIAFADGEGISRVTSISVNSKRIGISNYQGIRSAGISDLWIRGCFNEEISTLRKPSHTRNLQPLTAVLRFNILNANELQRQLKVVQQQLS